MNTETIINNINKPLSLREVLFFNVELDKYFGISDVDFQSDQPAHYQDVSIEALSTSYSDYYQIISCLKESEILVDLGAGHGRGTFLSTLLGKNNVKSVEVVTSRLEALKRFLSQAKYERFVYEKSIVEYDPSPEDVFYLYFPLNKDLLSFLKSNLSRNTDHVLKFIVCESHGDLIPFFQKLSHTRGKKLFKSSMPRHNEWIMEFHLNPQMLVGSFESNFLGWWISHSFENYLLEFEYFHKTLGEKVVLYQKTSDLDLVYKNESFYLQNIHSGRIFNTDTEFMLKRSAPLSQYSQTLQDALNLSKNSRSKLIFLNTLLIEDSSGQIFSV